MARSTHVCRYRPGQGVYQSAGWRGHRVCEFCGRRQFQVATVDGKKVWRDTMTLSAFANKWLPAISGTQPEKMMTVDVAFPFEWNCYESWNVVWRVRFDFTEVLTRTQRGLGTRVDVMNGWRSEYAEDFCRIDEQALKYYKERTERDYDIGDNTYGEMRAFIQAPIAAPKPPELKVV